MHAPIVWWKRPTLLAALVCAIVGLALLGLRFVSPTADQTAAEEDALSLFNSDQPADGLLTAPDSGPPARQPTPAPQPTATPIVVYISGAVVHVDAYELPPDARVKDLILAAGGLAPDADAGRINLAARVQDEQHIHVPRVGEAVAPAMEPAGGGTTGAASGQVNINTASAAELEDLPGIGQTLAGRIVTYRTAEGPFAAVDDLRKVPGIGASLLENLRPLITVGR